MIKGVCEIIKSVHVAYGVVRIIGQTVLCSVRRDRGGGKYR